MENLRNTYSDKDRLRSYSSIFSSTCFSKLLNENDYSFLKEKIVRYDREKISKFETYTDYLKYTYRQLLKNYRNEYIYKNTIINEILIKEYGTKESVIFNELKAGKSVADLAIFNGISKVFEIKTELDSEKRLKSQLSDYTKVFQKCYIVTFESLVDKYLSVDESIGIIVLKIVRGHLRTEQIREAQENASIDANVLMRGLRTSEYKNIVKTYYGYLPDVSSFELYAKCREMVSKIPDETLNRLFIAEIKKRKTNTKELPSFLKELRQICLSMNINKSQYKELNLKLNQPIRI
ncbi:sce7726 family protein [Phocaeicola sp.]